MAGVILVLGLIAAGIYTGNVAFYWVAGGMGILYVLFILIILSIAGAARSQMKKMDRDFYSGSKFKSIRGRRPHGR